MVCLERETMAGGRYASHNCDDDWTHLFIAAQHYPGDNVPAYLLAKGPAARLIQRFPDLRVIEVYDWRYDDEEHGLLEGARVRFLDATDAAALLLLGTSERMRDYQTPRRGLGFDRCLTPDDVCRALGVGMAEMVDEGGVIRYYTSYQWQSVLVTREREKVEEACAWLSARHEVLPYTFEFLDALTEETALQRAERAVYQEGLREDGPCIGWGASYEQWADEYHAPFDGERYCDDLWGFVRRHQRMLYGAWCEARGVAPTLSEA